MVRLAFNGAQHTVADGETVLECLERHGHRLASVCRSGVCQSCMLRCDRDDLPSPAQRGLKDAWKAQGYFLPCVCKPELDLIVEPCDGAGLVFSTEVVDIQALNDRVVQVHLRKPEGLSFEGGQFVHVIRPYDGLSRPYSIASLAEDPHLELHVRVFEGGQMSTWLQDAKPKTSLQIRGASGECIYLSSRPEQPLLLAGTGTGLSPLLGVLRTALKSGHSGPIHLYHGGARPEDLYRWEALRALERSHDNLRVHGCVRDLPISRSDLRGQTIEEALLEDHPRLNGYRVYLCGNPTVVTRLKKKAYLAGAALAEIHSDPFVTNG